MVSSQPNFLRNHFDSSVRHQLFRSTNSFKQLCISNTGFYFPEQNVWIAFTIFKSCFKYNMFDRFEKYIDVQIKRYMFAQNLPIIWFEPDNCYMALSEIYMNEFSHIAFCQIIYIHFGPTTHSNSVTLQQKRCMHHQFFRTPTQPSKLCYLILINDVNCLPRFAILHQQFCRFVSLTTSRNFEIMSIFEFIFQSRVQFWENLLTFLQR